MQICPAARLWYEGPLGHDTPVDEAFEFHTALSDKLLKPVDIADADHPQVFLL